MKAVAEALIRHAGHSITVTEVCLDGGQASIPRRAAKPLLNAGTSFHRFHTGQIVNEAVDKIRRREPKDRKDVLAETG